MQSSVVAACAEDTINAVTLRVPCALILNSGLPNPLKQHGILLEE